MKQGEHLTIPEGPWDVEQLWETAAPLDPDRLPDWISLEEITEYRFLGSVGFSNLPGEQQARYFQERIPKVRVIMIEGGPHVLSAAAPDQFLPPVLAFLERGADFLAEQPQTVA